MGLSVHVVDHHQRLIIRIGLIVRCMGYETLKRGYIQMIPNLGSVSARCPWCGNIVYKTVGLGMNLERVVFECIYNFTKPHGSIMPTGCKRRFIGLILFKVTVEEIQKVFDE